MHSNLKSAIFGTLLASAVLSSPIVSSPRDAALRCTEFMIPVTAFAENYVLPFTTPISFAPINGTFNIGARYCEPEAQVPERSNTLQLLVHGITYTRNYWSGDGAPGEGFDGDSYSWIAYAASRGYPTLSIDRICNGLSDHPDGTTICQLAVNVEVVHQVVVLARSGRLPISAASKVFNKLVFVGHSYGSNIGNYYNFAYPDETDATILTGWDTRPNFTEAGALLFPALSPAALVNPVTNGNLAPDYEEFNNIERFQSAFYAGNFDPGMLNLDYSVRGTVTSGELSSEVVQFFIPAPSYTGSVLIATAQLDAFFCYHPDGLVQCSDGAYLVASTKNVYPNAASLDGYVVPEAGHCWNFHRRGREGFNAVHDWLEKQGF